MTFVFDFGGVLFDWHPPRLLQRELPHRATDDASTRRLVADFFQGYGGDWGDFDRGRLEVPELVARITARTGLAEREVRAVLDGVPRELQPVPATVDLLRRLHVDGRRLFYLSNMPAPYADHLEREHDFVHWFEGGVFSGRVGEVKPDAAIFDLAAARYGVPASELVFIDDMPLNVKAARKAGWKALRFVDAAQCEAELRDKGWLA
jgi:HAD superfamily hydrolase (TIGR01509 family)